MKIGFDNDKYLKMQSEHIRERMTKFGGKLYLEFGGKLFDDYHASRVLPGFKPDSKLQMLLQLKEQAEIVIVISAEDIASNKVRGDYGITYDLDVLRLIDAFTGVGLYVGSVCITKFFPYFYIFSIFTVSTRDFPCITLFVLTENPFAICLRDNNCKFKQRIVNLIIKTNSFTDNRTRCKIEHQIYH